MTESPLMNSSFAVPVFSPGDDPNACLNKAMAFLIAVASSRQELLNVITVKVKDIWLDNALSLNDQGMQHDPGVLDGQAVQKIIPNNAPFQTEDLDTCDSDCDDISNAKAALIFFLEKLKRILNNHGYDSIGYFEKMMAMPVIDDEFDSVVKKRTTPNACTEGEWGFEHTKAVFNNEIIPFLKSLKDIFNVFDRDLLNEIMEVQTVFDQMDAAAQQFSIDKQCLEIAKKELFLEND
ncbi:hypothetical protein Tco_0772808 [Tanacetum coccineum]|uniref:Uncharacterized protein n=1 Tax=Tanacetum coccineum TaxID=301880 RepID=A0ABQ4ZLW3_9ASTR